MPLSSRPLNKRWLAFELPILPFLAPRVFAPWPPRARRAHSSTQSLSTHNQDTEEREILPFIRREDHSSHPSTHPLGLKDNLKRPSPPPDHRRARSQSAAIPEDILPSANKLDSNKIYTTDLGIHERGLSPKEALNRKYDEVWGGLESTRGRQPLVSWAEMTQDESVYGSMDDLSTIKESPKSATPETFQRQGNASIKLHPKEMSSHSDQVSINHLMESPNPEDNARIKILEGMGYNSEIGRKKVFTPKKLAWKRHRALQYDRRQIENFQLPERPTKWVSWKPGRPPNILSWERRFAALDARHQQYSPRLQFSNSSRNPLPEEFTKAIIEHESSIALNATWKMIPEDRRRELWPELMCAVLDNYPNSALKVLAATYTAPYPPSFAVSDCIDYTISHYLRNKESPVPQDALKIYGVVTHLLQSGSTRQVHLSQSSIYLLIVNLELAQVKRLYDFLGSIDHPLHQNTLMQFTYCLSNAGETDLAFEILKRISHEGGDFTSPKMASQMASLCANLLERNGRISTTTISDSQIFEFMLVCGMKPNLIIYNILLYNSFKGGDHETGWQIYDMIVGNGIKPDEHTYSILLNDSKLRMDHSALGRVVEMIKGSGVPNAHIGTDVLHAIFLTDKAGKSSSVSYGSSQPTLFERMLPVYCEYFDPQPLFQIIPFFQTRFGHLISQNPAKAESVIAPPAPPLLVMLMALLKESSAQSIINNYNWLRHLVSSRNPVVSDLMQSTHVYNIFLMAFGRSMQTLDWCPRIIGDMRSSTKTVSAENDAANDDGSINGKGVVATPGAEHSNRPQDRPAPDVYTWSILLDVFISHRQPRAAEKVLTMMESRNVTPNQVTWNSLISGYARMQDVTMTVDAIDRLEKAGFQADDYTIRGMSTISDRRRLIEAMKAKENDNIAISLGDRNKARRTEELLDKALEVDGHLQAIDGLGNSVPVVKDFGHMPKDPTLLYPPVRRPFMKLRQSQTAV